jgi:pimeloyl-ACP methyl ester carboxylesterase
MRVAANGIAVEVDDQGPASAPVVVLVMGLGMQLVAWPDELVRLLVARGFRVVRFDNRDIGLSQHFDEHGVPNLALAAVRHAMRLPLPAPYTLQDMAADTTGVLDALGIERAHVCGASMGGMIAQHVAARHAQRVRSLTLMMTTSGARHLPQPSWRVRHALLQRPASYRNEDLLAHMRRVIGVIGSPGYPPDPQQLNERLLRSIQRSWHPAGMARQLLAIMADGDRTPLLARIAAPVAVIHGEADPLVPVEAGRDLARRIAGARSDFIAGMGHDLPLPLLPRFADTIAENASRVA